MTNVETQSTIPKLPKFIIKEIFMYLPSSKIFKDRLYALNRQIYNDQVFIDNLFSQFLMQKLGVISDFGFEFEYLKNI